MYTLFLFYVTGKIILKKTVRGQKKSELSPNLPRMGEIAQPAITCSKLTIETLEQGVQS